MSATVSPLPDFELAPLLGIDPAKLTDATETATGRLILVLAVAYNDVKGIEYLAYQLDRAMKRCRKEHGLAARAQMAGMSTQLTRVRVGVLRELMIVLEKNFAVLASDKFKALQRNIPAQAAAAWQAVLAIGRRGDRTTSTSPDSRLLQQVRDRVAFHYDEEKLHQGYAKYFGDKSKAPLNAAAVLSDGRNAEETRFYFADAAMSGAIENITGLPVNAFSERLGRIASNVNIALRFILMSFIRAHCGELRPFNIPSDHPMWMKKNARTRSRAPRHRR